jgi:hypothetical protein
MLEPVELVGVWLLGLGVEVEVEVEEGLSRKEGNMLVFVMVIERLGLSGTLLSEEEGIEVAVSRERGVSSKSVRSVLLREGLGSWAPSLGLEE